MLWNGRLLHRIRGAREGPLEWLARFAVSRSEISPDIAAGRSISSNRFRLRSSRRLLMSWKRS